MEMNTLLERKTITKPKLRLFTLYVDYPAAIRARRLTGRIGALAGRDWELAAEMWNLDSVSPFGSIRDMIAQEAGESDVLVIAVSSVEEPDPAVMQWLNSLLNWKLHRPVPGVLIGLFGGEENKVGENNRLVERFAAFAQQTRMEFAWQPAGRIADEDSSWLAGSMKRLFDRKMNGATSPLNAAAELNVTAS